MKEAFDLFSGVVCGFVSVAAGIMVGSLLGFLLILLPVLGYKLTEDRKSVV